MSMVGNPAQVGRRPLDVDLIDLARAGDDEAFASLLGPIVASGYRLAGAMLHDRHAAEDVVQEASLKAWRSLHQLRAGAEMRPWFLGIVANECRSVRRTRWWSVLKFPDVESPAMPPDDPHTSFAELRRGIRRLRHRRRLMLVLHWYLDLPMAEIAVITRSSEDAVKSEVSRAMRQLRGLIGVEDA